MSDCAFKSSVACYHGNETKGVQQMFNYTRKKKEQSLKVMQSWESSHTESFDGVWGSAKAAGLCVSYRVQNQCRRWWKVHDFLPRLCVNRSWPARASGDITEMESYVASVVSDVLRKRREMDDLEAKTQERKLVRINTGTSTDRTLDKYKTFNEQNTPLTWINLLIVINFSANALRY